MSRLKWAGAFCVGLLIVVGTWLAITCGRGRHAGTGHESPVTGGEAGSPQVVNTSKETMLASPVLVRRLQSGGAAGRIDVRIVICERPLPTAPIVEPVPASGVTIDVEGPMRGGGISLATGSDGSAVCHLPPGKFKVHVAPMATERYEPLGFENPIEVEVRITDRTLLVEAFVRKRGALVIEGRAIEAESGTPVGPGEVFIRDRQFDPGFSKNVSVNEEGRFRFELPGRSVGEYYLVFMGFVGWDNPCGYVDITSNPTFLEIPLARRYRVEGEMKFPPGKRPGTSTGFVVGVLGKEYGAQKGVDKEFRFAFEGVPSGSYRLIGLVPNGYDIAKPIVVDRENRPWHLDHSFEVGQDKPVESVVIEIVEAPQVVEGD